MYTLVFFIEHGETGEGLPLPERVGRVIIHNRASNMKLVKTFAHLCHGDWTPGGPDLASGHAHRIAGPEPM